MILLIDNYDSFVHNLARYFRELGQETDVIRNDAVTVAGIRRRRPAAVVLSPGPCTPQEAGVSMDVVRCLADEMPILGVCLGHQAIAAALGARVVQTAKPVHGRTSSISHTGEGLFADMPNPLTATRYHSLIVEASALPESLSITAETDDGIVMALAHRDLPLYGVQFHPESVLTDSGHRLLRNFLEMVGIPSQSPLNAEVRRPTRMEDDFFQQPVVLDHPQPVLGVTMRESV